MADFQTERKHKLLFFFNSTHAEPSVNLTHVMALASNGGTSSRGNRWKLVEINSPESEEGNFTGVNHSTAYATAIIALYAFILVFSFNRNISRLNSWTSTPGYFKS